MHVFGRPGRMKLYIQLAWHSVSRSRCDTEQTVLHKGFVLCVAKDATSVDIMCKMFSCNF
jgi:hypothetical protein